MRRSARYVLNTFTGVSLLLCSAFSVLWLRSHYQLVDTFPFGKWTLISEAGCITIDHFPGKPVSPNPLQSTFWPVRRKLFLSHQGPYGNSLSQTFWNRIGFSYERDTSGWALAIPYWAIVSLTAGMAATLPAIHSFRRHRSLSTITKSLCRKCGYDLRATPDRCPECGTAPTKSVGISN
jgi:hypothetical protein